MSNAEQSRAIGSGAEADARRQALIQSTFRATRNNALMVAVLSAGGSAGGGVLLGGALAGPVGAVMGGVIGAVAAYKAFRDADDVLRPPADAPDKAARPVENH